MTTPFIAATDFTSFIGNTFRMTVACTRLDLSIVNLTNATMWATFKQSVKLDDTHVISQKTIGSGITVTDAPGGLAKVSFNPADLVATGLDQTVYYDVKVKEANGDEWTVAWGKIIFTQTATRAI